MVFAFSGGRQNRLNSKNDNHNCQKMAVHTSLPSICSPCKSWENKIQGESVPPEGVFLPDLGGTAGCMG